MNLLALLLIAKLPPINTANDAALQLKTGSVEAIQNVDAACRGKLRHALKDEPRVAADLLRLVGSGATIEVKKAALDAHRCLSAAKFVALEEKALADADPKVVAYAAEVSARVADPAVVPPLLALLEKRKAGCAKADVAAPELEVCVWLTYAPSASLAGADPALRERAGKAATEMLTSPHPKVREVAAETVAAARGKAPQ